MINVNISPFAEKQEKKSTQKNGSCSFLCSAFCSHGQLKIKMSKENADSEL